MGGYRVFANNLKRFMKLYGMSQRELAKLCDVSQQSVSLWLAGDRLPRMGKLQIIADYFGVLKSELLEDNTSDSIDRTQRIKKLYSIISDLTDEEADDILRYAEFIKSKRK